MPWLPWQCQLNEASDSCTHSTASRLMLLPRTGPQRHLLSPCHTCNGQPNMRNAPLGCLPCIDFDQEQEFDHDAIDYFFRVTMQGMGN